MSRLRSATIRVAIAVLVGAIVAAVGAVYVVRTHGLYSIRIEVAAIAPEADRGLQGTADSLVGFVGVLERKYNGSSDEVRFASPDATLVGSGVHQGSRVQLVNNGGQWASNYNQPTLIVEAVSPSRDWVQAKVTRIIADLRADAASLQAAAPQKERITLLPPQQISVDYSTGGRTRALAGVGALALLVGATTAGILRGRIDRRPRATPRLASA